MYHSQIILLTYIFHNISCDAFLILLLFILGKEYYFNSKTNVTQWDKPAALSAGVAAAGHVRRPSHVRPLESAHAGPVPASSPAPVSSFSSAPKPRYNSAILLVIYLSLFYVIVL